jgi:hypothetical protein
VLDPAFHEYLRDNPVVLPLTLMRRFHARPLFWDAASYLPALKEALALVEHSVEELVRQAF